jgi:WD40 repeat protein
VAWGRLGRGGGHGCSPVEKDVFASCSVDRTIKVWDTRKRGAPALSVDAHAADVNVLSWNRTTSHLLASGADDGTFSIWDLRHFTAYAHRHTHDQRSLSFLALLEH